MSKAPIRTAYGMREAAALVASRYDSSNRGVGAATARAIATAIHTIPVGTLPLAEHAKALLAMTATQLDDYTGEIGLAMNALDFLRAVAGTKSEVKS